jgi:Flp pilus assembly protein TadG
MRWRLALRDSRGNAAAEMALMLPLLVVLLFGTFEGGYFLWSEHKVIMGVRDGARYAARQDFSKFTCPSTIDPTVVSQIQNVTRTGYPNGDSPVVAGTDNPTVPGWTSAEVTVTLSCDSSTQTGIYAAFADGAPRVTVSARVPYPDLFGVIGFTATSLHLNASAQSAVMGL